MTREPNSEQLKEMLGVLAQAHAWIDTLVIAGVSENAALAALHQAIVERHLTVLGVLATAEWLQARADMVAGLGHELLTELRAQGN